jgi:hypothetical protein
MIVGCMQVAILYHLRDKRGNLLKVYSKLMTYSVTRMSPDGNLSLIRFQKDDKEDLDNGRSLGVT